MAAAEPVDCFLSTTRVLAIATSFGITMCVHMLLCVHLCSPLRPALTQRVSCCSFVLVYAAAPFSGGHINPAVSLAFFLSKKLSVPRLACYWCACAGACSACSSAVWLTALHPAGLHSSVAPSWARRSSSKCLARLRLLWLSLLRHVTDKFREFPTCTPTRRVRLADLATAELSRSLCDVAWLRRLSRGHWRGQSPASRL